MQKTYITSLYKLIKNDKNVLSCLSDSGTDLDEMLAREFPEQVLNFGISENNKVAAAAGLATCNKIPFVYTTNAFIAYRSYEFVRDDICLPKRNVKLIGMGCGLSWSTLGVTHHTTEDIAVLKALPNLILLSPASPIELREMIDFSYRHNGPIYIRIGMGNEPEIYNDNYKFELGKLYEVNSGKDATIFVTGSITSNVLNVAKKLHDENINIKVINIPTIKPLDYQGIKNECSAQTNIISVEEHNIIGGIGESIAAVIAENNIDVRLTRIGLIDTFAHGYGTYDEVKQMNGIDEKSLYEKIKKVIQ